MLSTVGNRTPAARSRRRRRSGRSAIVSVPATGVVLVGAEDSLGAAGGAPGGAEDARFVVVRRGLAAGLGRPDCGEPVGEATELAGESGQHRGGGPDHAIAPLQVRRYAPGAREDTQLAKRDAIPLGRLLLRERPHL